MTVEKAIIKVVGVGGAGCNAVAYMIREGVMGVEYICADTDSQSLMQSSAGTKLQIAPNLGSGNDPSASIKTAIAERDRIVDVLRGADMVFIIAGMGGVTGTAVATMVAEVTHYLEIFTVAVVTRPFESESQRMRTAERGLAELVQHVSSLIVLSNEKLKKILGEQVSMPETFRYADTVLKIAVGSIADIINVPGIVGVDFGDVLQVMDKTGRGMMGVATVAGVDRARLATEQALKSPLLEGADLFRAYGLLVNITASSSLELDEIYEVMNTTRMYGPDHLVFGIAIDVGMNDGLRVTIFATSLGS